MEREADRGVCPEEKVVVIGGLLVNWNGVGFQVGNFCYHCGQRTGSAGV